MISLYNVVIIYIIVNFFCYNTVAFFSKMTSIHIELIMSFFNNWVKI